MAESKKITVSCGYKVNLKEGEKVRLWGVEFVCDGKLYKAELSAADATAMIDAGRVVKA